MQCTFSAGRWYFRYTALPAQVATVRAGTATWFANEQHVTISLDGWTSAANKSYYVVVACSTSGDFRFLDLYDMSDMQHTANQLLGMPVCTCVHD